MNKQELIEKYEKLEGVCKDPGAEIAHLIFLEDLRELDEPQKESRYIVKVKGVRKGSDYLNFRTSLNEWFFSGKSEPLDFRTKHTRKELKKAGFGWVFDCPGIEIEEAEG